MERTKRNLPHWAKDLAELLRDPSHYRPKTAKDRAKKAELLGNAMWRKYPRAMLRSRVASEGIRTVYPGVLCGMYTPEEVESFQPEPTPRITASQHKALEAKIGELGLDRERVKNWVFRASREAVEHFPDMTPEMFATLWKKLPDMAAAYHAERATQSAPPIDVEFEPTTHEEITE